MTSRPALRIFFLKHLSRAAAIAVAKKSKLSLPEVSGPSDDADVSMALLGPDGKVVARTSWGSGNTRRVPSSHTSSVSTSRASSLAPSAMPSSCSSSRASTPALAPTFDGVPLERNVKVKQEQMDIELIHQSVRGMALEEPDNRNQTGVQLQVPPGSGTVSVPVSVSCMFVGVLGCKCLHRSMSMLLSFLCRYLPSSRHQGGE